MLLADFLLDLIVLGLALLLLICFRHDLNIFLLLLDVLKAFQHLVGVDYHQLVHAF